MIATHFGTKNAGDARVREAFIKHLCDVNDELLTDKEDLLDEKAALAEENDALAKDSIALRRLKHEVYQYVLVEQKEMAHRRRGEEKLAQLRPQAEALHRIASCVGVPAGADVTTETLPRVAAHKADSETLDQINAIVHRYPRNCNSAARFAEIRAVLLGSHNKKESSNECCTNQGA